MIDIDEINKLNGTELSLIILCCRVHFETATLPQLNACIENRPIKGELFYYLAKWHKVRPMVYQVICIANIPDTEKLIIQNNYTEITLICWKLATETKRLILLLKGAGITAKPYKGAAFSKHFFGDLISRESTDIDLLIDKNDLPTCFTLLQAEGYSGEMEDVRKYLAGKYYHYFKDYALSKFNGDEREVHVELHWEVVEKSLGVDEGLTRYLTRLPYQLTTLIKTTVPCLNAEAHFLAVLMHHGIKDNFRTLKNITDISQAFSDPAIQSKTDELYQACADFSFNNVFRTGNELSHCLFGIRLPLPPHPHNQASTYFIIQIGKQNSFKLAKQSIFRMGINRLKLEDSNAARLSYCWRCVKNRFIPGRKDFQLISYPPPLYFLYYLLKPAQSLWRTATMGKKH